MIYWCGKRKAWRVLSPYQKTDIVPFHTFQRFRSVTREHGIRGMWQLMMMIGDARSYYQRIFTDPIKWQSRVHRW